MTENVNPYLFCVIGHLSVKVVFFYVGQPMIYITRVSVIVADVARVWFRDCSR